MAEHWSKPVDLLSSTASSSSDQRIRARSSIKTTVLVQVIADFLVGLPANFPSILRRDHRSPHCRLHNWPMQLCLCPTLKAGSAMHSLLKCRVPRVVEKNCLGRSDHVNAWTGRWFLTERCGTSRPWLVGCIRRENNCGKGRRVRLQPSIGTLKGSTSVQFQPRPKPHSQSG